MRVTAAAAAMYIDCEPHLQQVVDASEATLKVRLHCSNDDFWHVLGGHGVPILLATLVAAVWGAPYTRM